MAGHMDATLHSSLDENLQKIRTTLHNPLDLVIRDLEVTTPGKNCTRIAVLYIDGLADKRIVHDHVILPLVGFQSDSYSINEIEKAIVTASAMKRSTSYNNVVESLISSSTIVIVDGQHEAIIISSEGWEHRNVSKPTNENSILGPQDAFNEVLRVNTALLRRKIKDPGLVLDSISIGRRSKTDLCIVYLTDVANPAIVAEVKRRLTSFDTDALIDSGELADFLEDQTWSPFPQVAYTERVDRIAAAVFEGRVAVLVDGSPFSIQMPITFAEMLFSSEDYYTKFYAGTLIRWIRASALFIAMFLPSIYIAISSFHQEMLPSDLMLMLAANRSGIPFPALVEALLMEFTFELLREASLRMPGSLGQTIGIVGALVIGQAAVQANLVGPVLTVIVSFTAIGSFVIPNYNTSLSIRILRFPIMFLAGTLGVFGIVFGFALILIHMVRLRSFGVGYMSSFTPETLREIDDSLFFKKPAFLQKRRPSYLKTLDRKRRS